METTLQSPVGTIAFPRHASAVNTQVLHALWNDDRGFIITAELMMISTIVVLGLIAGLACVRDAVTGELTDVADAIDSLNQSYSYTGNHGCWDPCCGVHSYTAGSCFSDVEDHRERDLCFDGPCHPRTPCHDEPARQVEPPAAIEPPPVVEPPAVVEPPRAGEPPQPAPDVAPPQATPPAVTESEPAPLYVPCEPCQDGMSYYDAGPCYSSP